MSALTALPYVGGKSGHGARTTGRWVASLLPAADVYVEPFGGMCGVLLQRPPARIEIYNDLDERVVTWWRVVRDRTDELTALLRRTPYSRAEYDAQFDNLDHPDPVRRALAVTVVLVQSLIPGTAERSWFLKTDREAPLTTDSVLAKLDRLAERMRNVQLEARDAVDVLDRVARVTDAVVYCDPPYSDTRTKQYAHGDVDVARLSDALARQTGFTAISGYGDEWNHLGWDRYERSSYVSLGDLGDGRATGRVEVLWTNRASPQRLF